MASAVCQKNIGFTYIETVFEKLGITPYQKDKEFHQQKNEGMKRKLLASKSVEKKR